MSQQVVKVYIDIKPESMDDAISWAHRFEGVTEVSRSLRSFRKHLKVRGEGIDGRALTIFLENKVGYAKLKKVRKAHDFKKLFMPAMAAVSVATGVAAVATDIAEVTRSRSNSPDPELS